MHQGRWLSLRPPAPATPLRPPARAAPPLLSSVAPQSTSIILACLTPASHSLQGYVYVGVPPLYKLEVGRKAQVGHAACGWLFVSAQAQARHAACGWLSFARETAPKPCLTLGITRAKHQRPFFVARPVAVLLHRGRAQGGHRPAGARQLPRAAVQGERTRGCVRWRARETVMPAFLLLRFGAHPASLECAAGWARCITCRASPALQSRFDSFPANPHLVSLLRALAR